jgi:hypothetical protein
MKAREAFGGSFPQIVDTTFQDDMVAVLAGTETKKGSISQPSAQGKAPALIEPDKTSFEALSEERITSQSSVDGVLPKW